MKSCAYIEQCKNLSDKHGLQMPKLASIFRERYCMDQFDQCARYRVAAVLGPMQIPDFMLPSQIEWAAQIIQEKKSESSTAVIRQTSSGPIP